MPKYCVTGGTGFIAGHLVKSLLENGHTVRTTVRDPGDEGKDWHLNELKGARERLRIMKADLMVEGSFNEAVHGVDGVFHTALLVFVPHDDNVQANLIDPCIKGTVNVLKSCSRASSVKRVVHTSSCSTIRYRDDIQQVSSLNESHRSDTEYCACYNLCYAYAKTIAEKEAWKLVKQNGINLVVVNPAFVVGPLLTPQPTSTLLVTLAIVKGKQKSLGGSRGEYPNATVGFAHAHEAVAAHVLAMEDKREPQAGSYVQSSVAHRSQIIEMLRAKYPQYPFENKCSRQRGDNNPHNVDGGKMTELGLPSLKSLEQMFDGSMKSFQDTGYL